MSPTTYRNVHFINVKWSDRLFLLVLFQGEYHALFKQKHVIVVVRVLAEFVVGSRILSASQQSVQQQLALRSNIALQRHMYSDIQQAVTRGKCTD